MPRVKTAVSTLRMSPRFSLTHGPSGFISQRPTCPASVGGEVMGVCGLQALLHLLEEIFDLILDLLLERCADLRGRHRAHHRAQQWNAQLVSKPTVLIHDLTFYPMTQRPARQLDGPHLNLPISIQPTVEVIKCLKVYTARGNLTLLSDTRLRDVTQTVTH